MRLERKELRCRFAALEKHVVLGAGISKTEVQREEENHSTFIWWKCERIANEKEFLLYASKCFKIKLKSKNERKKCKIWI